MLSAILVENPPEWSLLSEKALNGILTRASRRGKKLPDLLLTAIRGKGALVQKELSATLATHQDQTLFELRNMVLNDQGGGRMSVTQGTSGTLRAQEHGHPPITFDKMGGTEKT